MKHKNKPTDPRSTAIECTCDYCNGTFWERPCDSKGKEKRFCKMLCYTLYKRGKPSGRLGSGMPKEENRKRIKARSFLNHYLRDQEIVRPPCLLCGKKAEAHHDDYDLPLKVIWLCRKHHAQHHKIGNIIFENSGVPSHSIYTHYPNRPRVQPKGTKHPAAKLTDIDIQIIREAKSFFGHGCTVKIAKYYNVSFSTISLISLGKTWKHI